MRNLLSHCEIADFKKQAFVQLHKTWHFDEPPINMYLRWFAQNAELAQQVADAWNAVVERGEADMVVQVQVN